MAKQFTKLRDPKLQLTDVLPFGKFQGCRICDCVEDNYEYFQWLTKNTQIQFSQDVLDTITEFWRQSTEQRFIEEEVKPWQSQTQYFSDWDDDIPF